MKKRKNFRCKECGRSYCGFRCAYKHNERKHENKAKFEDLQTLNYGVELENIWRDKK
jgi:hypothetical protein